MRYGTHLERGFTIMSRGGDSTVAYIVESGSVGASSLYTIVGIDGVCVMAPPASLHCMMRGCGHNAHGGGSRI